MWYCFVNVTYERPPRPTKSMTTSSRVALKAGGTQMNGEISGKKIQNMDIMVEVRKTIIPDFLKWFLQKSKLFLGGVIEFAIRFSHRELKIV